MSRPGRGTATSLVHVMTVPESLGFLRGQVAYMKARGIEVTAISSPGEQLGAFAEREGVTVRAVEMPRRITPLHDLRAVWRLRTLLRQIRPAIVHAHTPKGGLLGMLAAWMARVPVRIYHIRGLPFTTAEGPRRALLRWTERVSCGLAHRVLCVSRSVAEVAVADGLCRAAKLKVLAHGSGNGVDALGRFDPTAVPREQAAALRTELGIPAGAPVVGFVGRLVRDKGLVELAAAWREVRERVPGAHLLLVGPFEPHDPLPRETVESLSEDPRVHLAGEQWSPAPFYRAMDLLVLPTHREGFPNVLLEAAAMRLPVVATAALGCVDAVQDGVTGTLVPVNSPGKLRDALTRYLESPELRAAHGAAGRERVLREFRPEGIWEALYQEYEQLLASRVRRPIGNGRVEGGRPCTEP